MSDLELFHPYIPARLRELRTRAGLSMAAVAKALGYKGASSYQRYESPDFRKGGLSLEIVRKLADLFVGKGQPPINRVDVYELAGITFGGDEIEGINFDAPALTDGTNAIVESLRQEIFGQPPDVKTATNAPALPSISTMPRDVPVYGSAVGGVDGYLILNTGVIDYVRRPPGVLGRNNVFALYVAGESMVPRYFPGDLVYIDPNRQARNGDFVVAELYSEIDGEPPRSFVKRLCRRTATLVIVEQYNPQREIQYRASEVKALLRIIDWNELVAA